MKRLIIGCALGIIAVLWLSSEMFPAIRHVIEQQGQVPPSRLAFLLLQAGQLTVLTGASLLFGVRFYRRSTLRSKWLGCGSRTHSLPVGHTVCALLVVVVLLLVDYAMLRIPQQIIDRLPEPEQLLVVGALYGGFVEEVVTKLLLLAGVMVLMKRLMPARDPFWPAAGITAVVFAALHIGLALVLAPTIAMIGRTLILNAVFMLASCWVVRAVNLEAGIAYHVYFHVANYAAMKMVT